MAREKRPTSQARASDAPSQVTVSITVTVLPTDRARRIREIRAAIARRRGRVIAGVALAAGVIALAAVLASLLQTDRTSPARHTAAISQQAAETAVASAFGYPRRCLSIAISAADPDYASAHVDRSGACANYRGYVNASFHRVDGVWRLVLDEGQLFVPNTLLSPGGTEAAGSGARGGYARGCVSVGVAFHDPRFGRVGFDRRLPWTGDLR